MFVSKPRVWLLGMLAVLLLGSVSAVSASANPGPICWHRENSKDTGARIPATAPEPFFGLGTKQMLETKIGLESLTISSTIAQIKGVIYNMKNQAGTAIQCQIKAWIRYQNPELAKPTIPGCTLTVGETGDNNIQIYGEYMWKYEGSPKELLEQPQVVQRPDLIVWPAKAGEVTPGGSTLPTNGEFTKINFGSKCGVFSNTKVPVKGTVGVSAANSGGEEGLEKWDKAFELEAQAEAWQHYWIGTEAEGSYNEFKPKITVNTESAKYKGPFAIEIIKRQQNPVQEVALKEGP